MFAKCIPPSPVMAISDMGSNSRFKSSTGWAVIGVDLLDNSQDVTINHTGLDSEYFVTGDSAHTPLETEVAPMTIKGDITHLILLVRCPQPPFYLAKGQILTHAIPVPAEVPLDEKTSAVYWAEVVGKDKPSMACNLTHGLDHFHVEGLLDMGADMTIIPERM
ncbi:endogenous retrovirus group K member 25 Pro protein-like protein [Turdus rufiventris]|nr:endogenous retrovirus group K member 25 Pro protein-like protein [Turdus rufiventris]